MSTEHTTARAALGTARLSAQRSTIVDAAASLPGAFTVAELSEAIRAVDPALGQATVYRAVAALEDSGWLERVGERGGAALYARCEAGDHHHHHVICTCCGRTESTECTLDLGSSGAAGFLVTGHEVTLYGLCPDCSLPRED